MTDINSGESIILDGYEKLTDVALDSILKCLTIGQHIKKFSCMGCIHLTDACIPLITQYCPNLETINLDGCKKLTSRALDQLLTSCKYLNDISIRNCNIRYLPHKITQKLKNWEMSATISSRKTSGYNNKKVPVKKAGIPGELLDEIKGFKMLKLNLNGNPMAECHEDAFKTNNAVSIIKYLNRTEKALTYHYRLVKRYH